MDLRLRCVASNPKASSNGAPTCFAFSSRHARLVTAVSDLLIDQSTSSNALHAVIRLPSKIQKLVYVGGSGAFLAFLENGTVASYAESVAGLRFVQNQRLGGADRTVSHAEGSKLGDFALFAKAESPSLWCLPVAEGGALGEPYKLRSDIEGEQENVNFVEGVFAKVRGKVATKPKSRTCPIAALASHPTLSYVAAAYANGILRVWDISRKQQRTHFDVQLLMGEKIVDIAMHAIHPVIVVCTSQGRIISCAIKSTLYKHGEQPALATSKTRDRKRRFRALCFLPGSPSYMLLLTASQRIVVRLINKSGMIVNSSRFPKASRPLSTSQNAVLETAQSATMEEISEVGMEDVRHPALLCEPTFGLIAATLDNTGDVYIFQPNNDGLPGIRRPLTPGLDTRFSEAPGNALKGPVLIDADSLVVHRGVLLCYELGSEKVTQVCTLPPGDAHRVEVARDEYGFCIAALIFYHGDDEVVPSNNYMESEPSARYVLCTKQGDAGAWTASEPGEGRSGCFLNPPGAHDRILILSSSGAMASVISFVDTSKGDAGVAARRSRGVQRFKFEGGQPTKVFRAPFASWSSVVYHDMDSKQLCVSGNTFQKYGSSGKVSDDFAMDHSTAFALRDKETVIDIRWQKFPTYSEDDDYLGAIMTDRRIYFVRDVFSALSVFEFQTISRIVVPFATPSFSWMGPSAMILFGNSLLSVTLDGRSDLVAGVSHGHNVTALVAALPDRIVYARPSPNHALNAVSIASRPYSAFSALIRGMLAMPTSTSRSGSRSSEQLRAILQDHDVAQSSSEITKALIENGFSSIAYLLAVSQQGMICIPPLRRAGFLGRMGDIRGALATAEREYAQLDDARDFHEGTELYRLLQRLLNLSFATGDFGVGRRCSSLLGRKGTFSAFLDVEGGYAAIQAMAEFAHANGHDSVVETLKPLILKSAKSSIAVNSSFIPTRRELHDIRRSIHSVDASSVLLGSSDKSQMVINTAPGVDVEGNPVPGLQTEFPHVMPKQINDRLEIFQHEIPIDLSASDDMAQQEIAEGVEMTDMDALQTPVDKADTPATRDVNVSNPESSDDDDIFNVGEDPQNQTELMKLDEEAQKYTAQTRALLQQQKEELKGKLRQTSVETHALMSAQSEVAPTGRAEPRVRAAELRDRAMSKLEDGRISSAKKDLDSALRAIQRGNQRGVESPAELIHELVSYKLLMSIRAALEEIRSSPLAKSAAGTLTYARLATAATALPLKPAHQVEALVAATDANIVLGNFGMAAVLMQKVKELGVSNEDMRIQLRDKYNACSARGFVDAAWFATPSICYNTLKEITPGARELRCAVCPAKFVMDGGMSIGDECPSCTLGALSAR